jgi:hypothetical protein
MADELFKASDKDWQTVKELAATPGACYARTILELSDHAKSLQAQLRHLAWQQTEFVKAIKPDSTSFPLASKPGAPLPVAVPSDEELWNLQREARNKLKPDTFWPEWPSDPNAAFLLLPAIDGHRALFNHGVEYGRAAALDEQEAAGDPTPEPNPENDGWWTVVVPWLRESFKQAIIDSPICTDHTDTVAEDLVNRLIEAVLTQQETYKSTAQIKWKGTAAAPSDEELWELRRNTMLNVDEATVMVVLPWEQGTSCFLAHANITANRSLYDLGCSHGYRNCLASSTAIVTRFPSRSLQEQWRQEAPVCRDAGVTREHWLMSRTVQWMAARNEMNPPVTPAQETLSANGVFRGHSGLEGLVNADTFWEKQPYGTRLYYGDGAMDYLHRDVLRSTIKLIERNCVSPPTPKPIPNPATREITQIAAGTDGDNYPKVVWALCSDRTLWSYIGHPQYRWERHPDIPTD